MQTRMLNVAAGTLVLMLLVALLTGCASTQYGDGKIGPVPLDPAVDALAKAIDSRAPGAGNHVRQWFATSGIDRVPAGYQIKWTAYLDGKAIDETAIVRVPTLAPREGPVMPVEIAPPPSGDLADILNEIGNAAKPK